MTMTNKNEEKRMKVTSSVGNNGGGIAGILMFGGALALAGLIAVASFATNKNKPKPNTKPKPKLQPLLVEKDNNTSKSQDENDHDRETTQGLRSLLQHSTTLTSDSGDAIAARHGTSDMSINLINSSELVPIQTLLLGEKIDLSLETKAEVEESPTSFHHQEIAFSDDSQPHSATSSNGNGAGEQQHEMDEDENKEEEEESLKSAELTETETETDCIEEDEDDVVICDSSEEEQDSSKATDEEPIWPQELIEEAEQKFKGGNGIIDVQSEAVGEAKTNFSVCGESEANLNEKGNLSVALKLKDQGLASKLFQLKTSIIPVLLLALLFFVVLLCVDSWHRGIFLCP